MQLFETIVVAIVFGYAAFVTIRWMRLRAEIRADGMSARFEIERRAAFVDCARKLSVASRTSAADVRAEIDGAVRSIAPEIDSVVIYEEQDGELRCVYAGGERVSYFLGARIARDDVGSPIARARTDGHRVALDRTAGLRPLHPADHVGLAVPLVLDAGRSAVVYVASTRSIAPDVAEALVTIIDHAASAYAIALEREADRERAEFDALTGLLTPRALRMHLGTLVERAQYQPLARIALLFVDTDRFKSWNDNYGHSSGDALLRELARLLREAVRRDGELAARNGGDEFCVVFVDTEKSQAIDRAEALRAAIAATDMRGLRPADAEVDVHITASIGVACYPVDATTPAALLERADEAMYHTKRNGRDGVSYIDHDGTIARRDRAADALAS